MGEQARAENLRYDRGAKRAEYGRADLDLRQRAGGAGGCGGHGGPTPIFIVGMPRSGTTLIESVIGAHSEVATGGETAGIRTILPDFLAQVRAMPLAQIPEAKWMQWRAVYRELLPPVGTARFVTDKNPWNFDSIGLILRLFPDARIIHVRRNPSRPGSRSTATSSQSSCGSRIASWTSATTTASTRA